MCPRSRRGGGGRSATCDNSHNTGNVVTYIVTLNSCKCVQKCNQRTSKHNFKRITNFMEYGRPLNAPSLSQATDVSSDVGQVPCRTHTVGTPVEHPPNTPPLSGVVLGGVGGWINPCWEPRLHADHIGLLKEGMSPIGLRQIL